MPWPFMERERRMSQEVKRVKILTLVELVLGVALIGFAIFLFVTGAAPAIAGSVVGNGLMTLFFGVRGALIANVPARMPRLVRFALIAFVVQVALTAAVVCLTGTDNVGDNPLPTVCCAVPALVSLVCLLLANGIAKRAER